MALKHSLLSKLACPIDHECLTEVNDPSEGLTCPRGHFYPIVDGIPVMLPEGIPATLEAVSQARTATVEDGPLYLATVLLSDDEKEGIKALAARGSAIDPVVAYLVGATNGIAYKHLIGTLDSYPIPEIRLPNGNGKTLLDVGCSWGRWTTAAARRGYQPIGLDPSLGAVMAARRAARDNGIEADFVVGDGRYLPFREEVFDQAFSYSVLQHLSFEDATRAFGEIGRVLKTGGSSLVQMPTRYGIRCLYNQLRRGFRAGSGFEVRYWLLSQLRRVFKQSIGPSEISVDCFFGIGWQSTDAHLMPFSRRSVLRMSEIATWLAGRCPPLQYVADSVYVHSRKEIRSGDDGRPKVAK